MHSCVPRIGKVPLQKSPETFGMKMGSTRFLCVKRDVRVSAGNQFNASEKL